MDRLKKDRKTAKCLFTRKCNLFEKNLLHDNNPYHIDTLSGLINDINLAFNKIETLNDQMIELSESDPEIETFNPYM